MNGVYVVIAEIPKAVTIPIGKQRNDYFTKGFYCYVGSALNGLEKRLVRHYTKDKKLHWHIDYLLIAATVRAVFYAETNRKVECALSHVLSRKLDPIYRFGCGDCKCKSHLFFAQDLNGLTRIVKNSFFLLGFQPLKYESLP